MIPQGSENDDNDGHREWDCMRVEANTPFIYSLVRLELELWEGARTMHSMDRYVLFVLSPLLHAIMGVLV